MSELDMDALRRAYNEALTNPKEAVTFIGLNASSTLTEVRAAFEEAYRQVNGSSGLDCECGRARLAAGIVDYLQKGILPDFVARHCAAIATGEHELT